MLFPGKPRRLVCIRRWVCGAEPPRADWIWTAVVRLHEDGSRPGSVPAACRQHAGQRSRSFAQQAWSLAQRAGDREIAAGVSQDWFLCADFVVVVPLRCFVVRGFVAGPEAAEERSETAEAGGHEEDGGK